MTRGREGDAGGCRGEARRSLETPGARRPVAAVALAREIGDRLDRVPSRAPVAGQFRLVEAVETIARGDAVGGNDQVVEIPPAVVAARMDRRHELRAKADAAVIAIEFELDVAVEPLRVVRQFVAPFPFMVAGVPAVARVVLDGRARARAVTDEDERTGVAIARLGGGLMMIDGSGRAGLAAFFGRDGDQRVIAAVVGRTRY